VHVGVEVLRVPEQAMVVRLRVARHAARVRLRGVLVRGTPPVGSVSLAVRIVGLVWGHPRAASPQ
jgi:hypothetical protein